MSVELENPYDCPAPPTAQTVATRALILSAIVCRGNSDYDPTNPDAVDLWNRLKAWIESLDIESEIEPAEKSMIYAPLGSIDRKNAIHATWQAEGLGILAWALGRFPFPSYDQKVDAYDLTDGLAFLDEEAWLVIQNAELRPRTELDACRELFYAMHCRARGFKRNRQVNDITSWIQPTWLEMLGVESPLGPTGDLRIGEVEISASEETKVNEYEWALCERHRAIIWLVGEAGPIYSHVPVDT